MGRAGPGPVDYGFDRAGPGLGLEYMGPGWSGPRVGEPVANTAPEQNPGYVPEINRVYIGRRHLSGWRYINVQTQYGTACPGKRRQAWVVQWCFGDQLLSADPITVTKSM